MTWGKDSSSLTSWRYPYEERRTFYFTGDLDSACIGCALCAGTAPDLFSMSEDGSAAFVSRQPGTGAEIESAAQALSECPVAAIGNDG